MNFDKSRKVLVTGAGGFIGANLVHALLVRGDEVHVLRGPKSTQWRLAHIKSRLRLHYGIEINNHASVLALIDNIQPEYVFHLAHYGGNRGETQRYMIQKVIIEGAIAIFNACVEVGSVKAIINAGSSSEYGAKLIPMKESTTLVPDTYYGFAKAWATLYGQYLGRENKIPITTLRLFSVFGPWEAATRFIPTAILACLGGRELTISDPQTVRDFVFVDNVVEAFLLAANKRYVGEIINIGFGRQMTLQEVVEIILEHTQANVQIKVDENYGRIFDRVNVMWQADISKAKKLLGWQPKHSQQEGIIKTVKWFHENKGVYPNV